MSNRRRRRKSLWSGKFIGHFAGKSSRKWAAKLSQGGGRTELEQKSAGKAKQKNVVVVKCKTVVSDENTKTLAPKGKAGTRGTAQKKQAWKNGTQGVVHVSDSPWLGQAVRVVAEGLHEGRVGKVTSVDQYVGIEPAEYRLQAADAISEKAGGVFLVRDKQVEVQRHDYTQASSFKLDYRLFAKSRREAMAKELASSLLEYIVSGTTLELGTVQALLAEVQLRVPVPQNSLVVEPTISHLLSEDLGEDVVSGAHQREQQHWKEKLEAA